MSGAGIAGRVARLLRAAGVLLASSALCGAVLPILPGCASRGVGPSGPISLSAQSAKGAPGGEQSAEATGAVAPSTQIVAWTFDGVQGQRLVTQHFDIHTTDRSMAVAERLPGMMEAAVKNYTTAFTALAQPKSRLDMYVMATRPQWQKLTLMELGERGRQLIGIARGGFSIGGRAFLFDIGSADTMSIACHEGWHQYSQRNFAEALPVWAEEGCATFMEGHRWRAGGVIFSGWNNAERFDRLREAVDKGDLLPLETVLTAAPDQILAMGNEAGVTYYAQVWAMVHFLREGEGGKYKAAFERLLKDAQAGRISAAVVDSTRRAGNGDNRGRMLILARGLGTQVFRTYINPDLSRAEAEYRAFISQIVAPGSKQRVISGQSPIGQ